MKYLADRTTLPVPNILSYELDPNHPLGPFILMGKVGPVFCLVFPRSYSVTGTRRKVGEYL